MEPNSLLAQFNSGRAATQALPSQVEASSLQMDPRTQTAYLMNNALQPRQTRGQNVGVNRFREAEDIRRNTENNRLDLRSNMNNEAKALEGSKQREFLGQEGEANRAATQANTDARIKSNELMQKSLFTQQERLQDDQQEFQLKAQDKRLANSLELAGLSSDSAKELAQIRGGFQIATTTAEIGQRAAEAKKRFSLMRKELKQKKTEAKKDREAMLQGKVVDQAGATVRSAMQYEMAESELEFQEKMFTAEQKLAQDKFDQQKTDREAFGKNVGQVMDEYNKWKSSGMQVMREDLRDNWVRGMGLSFASRNQQIFKKIQPDGSTVTIPMRSGREKKINEEWVDTLLANLDPSMLAHFEQNVDQVVRQRDSDFFGLLSRYMGVAATGGLPFNPTPNALQPAQASNPQPARGKGRGRGRGEGRGATPPSGPPKISPNSQKYFK